MMDKKRALTDNERLHSAMMRICLDDPSDFLESAHTPQALVKAITDRYVPGGDLRQQLVYVSLIEYVKAAIEQCSFGGVGTALGVGPRLADCRRGDTQLTACCLNCAALRKP